MAYGYNTSANKTRNNSYSYQPTQEPQTSVKSGEKTFNYSEVYSKAETNSSASNTKNKQQGSTAKGVYGITMGQTHNFTLYVRGLNEADNSFKLSSKGGLFLPLKSLDYKPVKLEHLKIKAGVFSDLPFFHRRSLGVLSCVMNDSSKGLLSQELFNWWNSCVSTAGCVPYVDDMCRNAEYTEFSNDGKVSVRYKFAVMPDGDISTTRTYDGDGALTEYKFNLIIVSEIQAV